MKSAARGTLREIALIFLKLGTTAISRQRFVEGLALVNMLPGAAATQLGIFLGYSRGGWWGGLVAGLCFVLPAFLIMLALTMTYGFYGATPVMKGALYGLGPVVLAIFVVAVYRLARSAAATAPQLAIATAAAVAAAVTPLGTVPILALAGGIGLSWFYSRRAGVIVVSVLAGLVTLAYFGPWSHLKDFSLFGSAGGGREPDLLGISSFFLMVGALSFGGGLTLIAFIQEQVVTQYQWLTHREFIDGLALGQFTPGPILMVAAYVGYKLHGVAGAAVAAGSIFLPAFVLMLSILPAFDRARQLLWTKAAMKGIGPAVIGVLAVSLVEMAPHAIPDAFAIVLFAASAAVLLAWQVGAIKLMIVGASLGMLRERILALTGFRATL
ncbi:MAG: chromate efflux transporter [Betaproteobacteria bacterium]